MLKKKLGVLLALVALLFGLTLSAGGASAATDVNKPGGCNLSANWHVNTSMNWTGVHGSPPRGKGTYAVITSPGPLELGAPYTLVGGIKVNGDGTGFAYFYRVGTGTNPYTYRADLNDNDVNWVYMYIYSHPSLANCRGDVHL